ncbi:MAG: hypothetical protein LBK66_00540 [Spirochaetaceae bacterium]|jgi:hypothetical protein|nr:hypothetical protein [Spirochaetaceae bacterium]
MAQTMTLKEKLAISMQVFALRDAGKDAEADILVKTIPMPPYLAKIWKKHGYLDHFVKDGWNITEVEAAFGQEWINS